MHVRNVNQLIDAVVRQTVVLIAQLATTGGHRAPLAHVANQVFLGLTDELNNQGISQRVKADMFGMALRSYQRKVRRLVESATETDRSLWEAVLGFIQREEVVTRTAILAKFKFDEEPVLRGILNDLVDSGLVFRAGQGAGTRYRAAAMSESPGAETDRDREALASMLWIAAYRLSPATRDELAQALALSDEQLDEALETLLEDGRITQDDSDGTTRYVCGEYLIPYESDVGWAAAVFDHYQAMVVAVCAKLRQGSASAHRRDAIGGSTFNFDVWEDHPFEDEVLGLLSEFRDRCHTLRQRVDRYNTSQTIPSDGLRRTVVYVGQNIISDEEPAP